MSYLIRSHSLRPDGPVAKWGEEYKPRANMEFFDCVVEAIEPKDELQIKTESSLSRIYKNLLNDHAIARQ
jgi:hypothetical protein